MIVSLASGFLLYDLAIGIFTALGVAYFVHGQPTIEYRRFLVVTGAGLVLFLVGGPTAELLAPELVHWIHGTAALLVIGGMRGPVTEELQHDGWSKIVLEHPERARQPAEWMLPVDDVILELFYDDDLVLTPAIVAFNIGYSREEVNRRLVELEERGFVAKVERGKYRITPVGARYIEGTVEVGSGRSLRRFW